MSIKPHPFLSTGLRLATNRWRYVLSATWVKMTQDTLLVMLQVHCAADAAGLHPCSNIHIQSVVACAPVRLLHALCGLPGGLSAPCILLHGMYIQHKLCHIHMMTQVHCWLESPSLHI